MRGPLIKYDKYSKFTIGCVFAAYLVPWIIGAVYIVFTVLCWVWC